MDNLTHTLVGACLAEAGLKRRTALGSATLMIGANFPDIDVVAVPLGVGLEWRRGVTHGFVALAVLPFVLAAIMAAWDRRRRRRRPEQAPADFRQLLLLSALSIATHPTLDFMNSYGMRWLMPFVDRWFYADGLFIVDLWLLVALVLGVVLSRREQSPKPARVALLAVTAYVVAMLGVTSLAGATVSAAHPGKRFMANPSPVIPWQRDVLVEEPDGYRWGRYSPFTGLWVMPQRRPRNDMDSAAVAARRLPEVRRFLGWARFPAYEVRHSGDRTLVRVYDERYEGAGWAALEVTLP